MATQLGFREEVITVIEEEMGFSPSDPPASHSSHVFAIWKTITAEPE